MTKFTQLNVDGEHQLHQHHRSIPNGIPKTITVDNLAFVRDADFEPELEEEEDEIMEVSIPAEDSNGSLGALTTGVVEPPKPPPRSTSIYHLQRLQQQAYAQAEEYLISQLEQHRHQKQLPGNVAANYPNVVMRDKSKNKTQAKAANQQQSLPHERPKSDIYEVRNALNNHVITGTGGGANGTGGQRPMSMFVDGAAAAAAVGAGRPVRHAISRFSAYEISVCSRRNL